MFLKLPTGAYFLHTLAENLYGCDRLHASTLFVVFLMLTKYFSRADSGDSVNNDEIQCSRDQLISKSLS